MCANGGPINIKTDIKISFLGKEKSITSVQTSTAPNQIGPAQKTPDGKAYMGTWGISFDLGDIVYVDRIVFSAVEPIAPIEVFMRDTIDPINPKWVSYMHTAHF